MYQYRSSRPAGRRRGMSQFVLPFIIIALLVGIVWAAWSLISRIWVSDNRNTSEQAVQLSIDSGSVKVMMEEGETWENVTSSTAKINPGEKVRVGPDGQASLIYSPQMELRLNRSAEVELTEFEENEGQYTAETQINEGMVWASLGNLTPTNSTFSLTTEYLSINADSAKFAVQAPGTVYMVEGRASVDIMEDGEPVKSLNLGVGQQLVVDQDTLADLKEGNDDDLIFALDDDFKRSSFYLWNAEQEGWSTTPDEGDAEEDEETGDSEDEDSADEDEDTEDEKNATEDEDEDTAADDDKDESVTSGKVEITSPSKEAEYESKTMDFNLEATVPGNTAKVVINGSYTLQQFKAGDSVAKYYVIKATGNVKEGKNTYSVTAYDKNDKEIGKDSITVNVVASEETNDNTSNENTSGGTVSITSPSSDAAYETTNSTFNLKATVPSGTAKVVVNDYTLSGYSAGSSSAVYYVKPANGNVKEGENTYTVTAYDSSGKSLGSDTIKVTVKAGSNTGTQTDNGSANTGSTLSVGFGYPSQGGTYSTTLSPILIGGSVSSDIRNLYINDEPLASHALGNTTWSYNLTLQPGVNTIKIYGENETNDSTGVKTLTIDYQGQ